MHAKDGGEDLVVFLWVLWSNTVLVFECAWNDNFSTISAKDYAWSSDIPSLYFSTLSWDIRFKMFLFKGNEQGLKWNMPLAEFILKDLSVTMIVCDPRVEFRMIGLWPRLFVLLHSAYKRTWLVHSRDQWYFQCRCAWCRSLLSYWRAGWGLGVPSGLLKISWVLNLTLQ